MQIYKVLIITIKYHKLDRAQTLPRRRSSTKSDPRFESRFTD